MRDARTSERLRRISKESAWVASGQAAAVLGSLAGVRLLTELLDPGAYGELALGMTLATLVNQTVLGPLGNGVLRFYAPALENGEVGGYLGAVRGLLKHSIGVVGVTAMVTIAAVGFAGHREWIAIVLLAFVFSLLNGFYSVLSNVLIAARQRDLVAVHQGLEPWARFLLAVVLIVSIGASSAAAMIGFALGAAAVLVSQFLFLRKTIPATGHSGGRKWRGEILKYSWPISVFGVFTWLQLASDRWALGLFGTTHDVGLYSALFQLGYYPTSVAIAAATQLVAPIFYQRAGDATDIQRNAGVRALGWRLTGISLGLTGVTSLLAFPFHPQIFHVLVAEEYASVSYLLPWMLLAGGIFASAQIVSLNLMSELRTRALIAPKVTTAALGVAANVAGAYFYGIPGIVAAGVLFSVSYLVWMALLSRS